MQLHHTGIACKDIEAELASIRQIHKVVSVDGPMFDPEQQATLALITLTDGYCLELISGKPVENLLKKGIGYYHLCFEVADINAEIARLVGTGALLISPPKPAILFGGRQVAFLQVSYGLIELLALN